MADDVLQGGREDDTYIYTRGDGNDTIIEVPDAQTSAFDTLVLHASRRPASSLVRDGNDIVLAIAESAPGAGDGGSVRSRTRATISSHRPRTHHVRRCNRLDAGRSAPDADRASLDLGQ